MYDNKGPLQISGLVSLGRSEENSRHPSGPILSFPPQFFQIHLSLEGGGPAPPHAGRFWAQSIRAVIVIGAR